MWSLGVCLFGLLNGFFPADEAKASDWRFQKLCKAQEMGKSSVSTILAWYKKTPAHLSGGAIDLLDQLLVVNPAKRPTIQMVGMHQFVTGKEPAPLPYNDLEPGSDLHYRGMSGYGAFTAEDMEIVDDGPVYRSLNGIMGDEDDGAPFDAAMPVLGKQKAFGGAESLELGDIFA